MRLLCMGVPSKMVRLGLTQIDLIIQILLFPLRVPRFLRDTLLPLADCADAAERRRKGQYNKRRRCLTMLNRWWSDSATCGERIPHYHSASKMSNNVVPLRGTLLLVPPLRRLRPCGLASGYAWFAISDGTSSLQAPLQHRITSPSDGTQRAQPRARLQYQ